MSDDTITYSRVDAYFDSDDDLERSDGWVATNASLGSVRDKASGLEFSRRPRLTLEQLDALYEQNPFAARIVDKIVDTSFSKGFELADIVDEDGKEVEIKPEDLEQWTEDFNVIEAGKRAHKWSRKDGGALLMLPCLDMTKHLDEPASFSPDTPLLPLSVVPLKRIQPLLQDEALNSPTYGRTLQWRVNGLTGSAVDVHHSRVILFEPVKLAPDTLRNNNFHGCGPSVLERLFDDLARDGAAISHALSMMFVSSILYVKLKGYRADHDSKGGPLKMRKLLAALRTGLDSQGILGLDVGDEIGNLTLTIAGANDIINSARERVAAAANMPKEILYNISPSGLNAGELTGPQEIWHNTCGDFQADEVTPWLKTVLAAIFATKGLRIKSFRIVWRPLAAKSDKSTSETHSKNAVADAMYMDKGVISADEVRHARFVLGKQGQIEVPGEQPPIELEIRPEDVAAEEASAIVTPADAVLNGAQGAMLIDLIVRMNAGEMTYAQAVAACGTMFPQYRGREHLAIGAPDAVRPSPGAAPGPDGDEAPSVEPIPPDVVRVQEAAAMFGLSTTTITTMLKKRKPDGSPLVRYWGFGSHKVVSKSELAAAARAHETAPAPPIVEALPVETER